MCDEGPLWYCGQLSLAHITNSTRAYVFETKLAVCLEPLLLQNTPTVQTNTFPSFWRPGQNLRFSDSGFIYSPSHRKWVFPTIATRWRMLIQARLFPRYFRLYPAMCLYHATTSDGNQTLQFIPEVERSDVGHQTVLPDGWMGWGRRGEGRGEAQPEARGCRWDGHTRLLYWIVNYKTCPPTPRSNPVYIDFCACSLQAPTPGRYPPWRWM